MSYKFVIITDEYINYLRKTEPNVMSNKAETRIKLNGLQRICMRQKKSAE